jgi:hypothetical protein
MKTDWKKFLCVLLLPLLAVGPRNFRPQPVVERIEVTCLREGREEFWRYTDPEQMTVLLNYLRQRKSLGPPDADPERIKGSAYRLEVWLTDGRKKTYRLRADRYFSRENRPWQRVDGNTAVVLPLLLRQMPPAKD